MKSYNILLIINDDSKTIWLFHYRKMIFCHMYEVPFNQPYFDDTGFALIVENIQEVAKRKTHFCFYSLSFFNNFIGVALNLGHDTVTYSHHFEQL